MTFAYDLYLNFQEVCYDFYEWNKKDNIYHIKKIPIFEVTRDTLREIIRNNNQVDKNTFNTLLSKAEVFGKKGKITAALLTDKKNIIAILLDKLGKIIKKSSLLIEEEKVILKDINKIDFLNIELTQLEKKAITLETRLESERKKFLLKEITNMKEAELIYLYFECFGKKMVGKQNIEEKLKQAILTGDEKISTISYNFLKLICNK